MEIGRTNPNFTLQRIFEPPDGVREWRIFTIAAVAATLTAWSREHWGWLPGNVLCHRKRRAFGRRVAIPEAGEPWARARTVND